LIDFFHNVIVGDKDGLRMTEIATTPNVRTRISELTDQMTASELKVASVLMSDYPHAGLVPIQEFAKKSRVSAPSITRFVAKLGCAGYQDFQRRLIGELKQRELSPIELKITEEPTKGSHFLTDYTHRLVRQMKHMAESIPPQQFERVCDLIADPSRDVYLLGGRVTDSLAALLSIHLLQMRKRIYHLPSNPELWPEYILGMRKQDVVVLFDVRRYQKNLSILAEIVSQKRQSTIVAITDIWMSPVADHAAHVFALPIELDTAWGTLACMLTLVEAIIQRVSESNWTATRKRIEDWDEVRFRLISDDKKGASDAE
jgi:DNA-binding MurR/RpiR family transcriptional regulator